MTRLTAGMMLFLFMLSCVGNALPAARAEESELTIMVYLCGADLESEGGSASGDIREMLSSGIGGSEKVSVLLATGGASQWQRYGISSRTVQYYRLGETSPELLLDAGRRSMGDPDTLSDFLRYSISSAPANRYMLILWDHGGGPVFGLCNDENYEKDSLSLQELKTGLQNGLGSVRLDIIGFDCCLMNCVDLCADLYGLADYAVLSQELVSGTGLDYDGWMKPLAENPALPAQHISTAIAETYVADNSRRFRSETATMSVIATEKMPAVTEAADDFSAALVSRIQSNLSGVIRLRSRLTSFGEFMDSDASDLVDVSDLCDTFSTLLPRECSALKQAAEEAVVCNCTTADIADYAHGMSFFMPCETALSDSTEILSHYSGQNGAYASLAVALTREASASDYYMTASAYTPSSFFSYDGEEGSACTGSFCDIWDGYFGDYCSFSDAYNSCGGNIWAGMNTESGSVWAGYSSSAGLWDGYPSSGTWGSQETSPPATPSAGGIWAGLPQMETTPAPAGEPASASAALNNIWAGLLNTGSGYYQQGEPNQNVQAGISEAVSAGEVMEAAESYFSSAVLNSQMIYSVQLSRTDLDHLAEADGVLSLKDGEDTIRLGNLGQTAIDWSTGLVFSMFDGSWPLLEGRMVRAEILYEDEKGNVRFVIPARINGLKMYLLGNYTADGETEVLGATQGYDESGFAIRGFLPLEAGMTVHPLFTAVAADGSEREYEGEEITVPARGLELTWDRIPDGNYLYSFGLTDLSGKIHYTDPVEISF